MPDGKLQQLEALEAELSAVKRELRRRDQAWQAQLQIATRVHDSLLPRPVRHPQIDIDTRYVPVNRVGGDYCQVLFPGESSCYVTMCDVDGHAVWPALLAARVSSEVRVWRWTVCGRWKLSRCAGPLIFGLRPLGVAR